MKSTADIDDSRVRILIPSLPAHHTPNPPSPPAFYALSQPPSKRQLEGLPVTEQETRQTVEYVFAEMVQAIDALFTFATSSTEEECQQRAGSSTAGSSIASGERLRRLEMSSAFGSSGIP